mgnify:CR=1 FL=1
MKQSLLSPKVPQCLSAKVPQCLSAPVPFFHSGRRTIAEREGR